MTVTLVPTSSAYLRMTMGQDRQAGLALMHVHYATEIDLEEVINTFSHQRPCRMLVEDILHVFTCTMIHHCFFTQDSISWHLKAYNWKNFRCPQQHATACSSTCLWHSMKTPLTNPSYALPVPTYLYIHMHYSYD